MITFVKHTPYIYNGTNWVLYLPEIDKSTEFSLYDTYIYMEDEIPILDQYQFPTNITTLNLEKR